MDIFHHYTQNLDESVAFTLFCGPILAVVVFGMLLMSKSIFTGGIAKPSSKTRKCTTSTSESNNRNFSTTRAKHRKLNGANKKQQDSKNNKAVATLAIENWLQTDMYRYDSRLSSSCFQDNMTSYRSIERPNNIVIVPSGRPTSSGHANFSLNQQNKEKFGQKRPQKRSPFDYKPIKPRNSLPMYNEKIKENIKPVGVELKTSSNIGLNFRMQCTKPAPLKVSQNNSQRRHTFSYNNRNLCIKINPTHDFSASTTSTTSTQYPISSSSSASSASNSPAQSVNSSPTASPKRKTEYVAPVLRQLTKLNMNEQQLYNQMKRYAIDPTLLVMYGYPVDSLHSRDCVEIYKCLPKHMAEEAIAPDNQRHHRNIYGRKKNCPCSNILADSTDSGHSSSESSSPSTDSDSDNSEEDSVSQITSFYTPDGVYQVFEKYSNSKEKQCVRCSKLFRVNEQGDYLSFDSCTYHWGKLHNVYNGKVYANIYTCCQGLEMSEGCSKHSLHVWNGIVQGLNGPYRDFVHTQKKDCCRFRPKIYAMDCEMSYTGLGMEVTKVSVIAVDGSLVYNHFVWPRAAVVDYNTRFSGVSKKDFESKSNIIKTISQVQNDLLRLFDSDTILIGHGLDSDLRVLRIVHKMIVDTSVVFSHSTGFPYRRSLKNLTKSYLGRDIQCSQSGHNPLEDSQACLELMLWKIRKDLNYWQ